MSPRRLKIVIIGEASVGKSCLLLRFAEDVFDERSRSTVGYDIKSKTISVQGETVKLNLWDTAGSERYRTLTANFFRGAHGAVLVYDVANRDSFQKLDSWLNELENYSTYPNAVRMLVGNKVDRTLERQVSKEEATHYALKHNMFFVETSACTSENVEACFEKLVAEIIHTPDPGNQSEGPNIHLGSTNDQKSESSSFCGCC